MAGREDLGTLPIKSLTRNDIERFQATIFCYGLRLDHVDFTKSPDVLHVTDFTRNTKIRGSRPVTFEGIDDDQTLNVSSFGNRFAQVFGEYNSKHPLSRVDYDPNGRRCELQLIDKLMIFKIVVGFKHHQGQLQCRIKTIYLADHIHDDCEELRALYSRVVDHFPREFFNDLGDLARRVIPKEYLRRSRPRHQMPKIKDTQHFRAAAINNAIDSQDYRTVTSENHMTQIGNLSQESSDEQYYSQNEEVAKPSQATTSYSSSNSSTSHRPPSTQVKQEHYTGVIPDTEHPDDYVADEIHSPTPHQPARPSVQTNSIFASLNKGLFEDGNIYRASAYVVGSIPMDWTHICTKSYRSDLSLTDPQFQRLELILSDVPPIHGQSSVLSSTNSLVVTFTQTELEEFFGYMPIEKVYISLAKLGAAFWRDRSTLLDIELYKKQIDINEDSGKASVWTTRNFNIRDLVKNVDDIL